MEATKGISIECIKIQDIQASSSLNDNDITNDITNDRYYKEKISFIDSLRLKKEIDIINVKDNIEDNIEQKFKDKNQRLPQYSFKTDFTHYFSDKNKTLKDFIKQLLIDIKGHTKTYMLIKNSSSYYFKLSNYENIKNTDYMGILNYCCCLIKSLFDIDLTLNYDITDDQFNDIGIFSNDSFIKFTELTIPEQENLPQGRLNPFNNNIDNTIQMYNQIYKIKCILSNITFISQTYKQSLFGIINSYYSKIIDEIKLNNPDLVFITKLSQKYDLIIDNDNKRVNIIYDIIYYIIETKTTIIIGKVTFVIYLNTLHDIEQNQLNDSYIIIDTYEPFTTTEKTYNYIMSLNMRKNIVNPKLKYKNSKPYFNTIPKDLNNVKRPNETDLFPVSTITQFTSRLFNFIIHIAPYKYLITQHLFNLTSKKNYKIPSNKTIEEFDFNLYIMENTDNRPFIAESNLYSNSRDEDASYKMFFCADNDNKYDDYKDGNIHLGENLYTFFKEENDKNLFVGFIMNSYNYNILGKVCKIIKNVKTCFNSENCVSGHMNTFIIDKKKNIIIRFEPKGKESSVYCNVSKKMIIDYIKKSINMYLLENTDNLPNIPKALPNEFLKMEDCIYIDTSINDKISQMPQHRLFDDYCQTYSLYGALLYCINYNSIDFINEPNTINNTIKTLFSQINQDKAIKLQYYLKKQIHGLMKIKSNDLQLNNADMEAANKYADEDQEKIVFSNSNTKSIASYDPNGPEIQPLYKKHTKTKNKNTQHTNTINTINSKKNTQPNTVLISSPNNRQPDIITYTDDIRNIEMHCIKVLSNTKLDTKTQYNIDYYLLNKDFFKNLSEEKTTYEFRNDTNTEKHIESQFRQKHDVDIDIDTRYTFKTDITKYFIASDINAYMKEIKRDIEGCSETFIIFDNFDTKQTYIKLNNTNINDNNVSILNYGICLMNTFFDTKIANLTSENCSNKQISNIDIKTKHNKSNNNELLKKKIKTKQFHFSKAFTEIVIPPNDVKKQVDPNILKTIKCILSNLVFINADYKKIFTLIMNNYYFTLIDKIRKIDKVSLCIIDIDTNVDYFINKDIKTFNLFIDIIMNIHVEGFTKMLKINIGKLIHVIYFNTLDKITEIEKGEYLDLVNTFNSFVVIETDSNFTNADKCFKYVSTHINNGSPPVSNSSNETIKPNRSQTIKNTKSVLIKTKNTSTKNTETNLQNIPDIINIKDIKDFNTINNESYIKKIISTINEDCNNITELEVPCTKIKPYIDILNTLRKHYLEKEREHKIMHKETNFNLSQEAQLYFRILLVMNFIKIIIESCNNKKTTFKPNNLYNFKQGILNSFTDFFMKNPDFNMELFKKKTNGIIFYINNTNLQGLHVEPESPTANIIKYTDEIKNIETNLQKILDIIHSELRDRSRNKNNRTVISKILTYYIDNLQTTEYNSKNNPKVKLQYEQKKKSLGVFSKSKIHETLEAQNYYKFLLEANFFSKIITLLDNNNTSKESMLNRFNDFLSSNPNYSIDMFKGTTDEILEYILKKITKMKQNKLNNIPSIPTSFHIKNNNIDKKTKNNKTISNNIEIIKQYAKKLEQIGKLNKNKNVDTDVYYNKLKQIYDFIQKNINKFTLFKDNYFRNTKKTSFLNKFKSNTSTQKESKQAYYRVLLENNFIAEIIQNISNDTLQTQSLLEFIDFLKTKKYEYTYKEFSEKINSIKTKINSIKTKINSIKTKTSNSKN